MKGVSMDRKGERDKENESKNNTIDEKQTSKCIYTFR